MEDICGYKFKDLFPSIQCCTDLFDLVALPEDEQLCILSEINLLPSLRTSDYFKICLNHRENFRIRLKLRQKQMRCSLSPFLQSCCKTKQCLSNCQYTHSANKKIKLSTRHVTEGILRQIAGHTGAIVPIGTAICESCRKDYACSSRNRSELEICTTEDRHAAANDSVDLERTEPDEKRGPCNSKANLDVEEAAMDSEEYMSSLHSDESLNSTQPSQCSIVHAVDNEEKLDAFNTFLCLSNLSPVKHVKGVLVEASERTQRRYIQKAKSCISLVLDTICPGESDFLLQSVNARQDSPTSFLHTLVAIYQRAETWQIRRQVLSIISREVGYEDVTELIPGLTTWRYYEAKKHADEIGIGEPVPEKTIIRDRVSHASLDHFIDFITSSHIVKDLPFGEKTLKLSSGEIINVPNVIRCLAPTSLIKQYSQLCDEENVKPLGTSTMYRILTECAASLRTSVEGLDNYIMEGSRAFRTLEEHVDNAEVLTQLRDGKLYLKTDFKVHMMNQSLTSDHCLSLALSADDTHLQAGCNHVHEMRCARCMELDQALEKVLMLTSDNNDALTFKVEKAVEDIQQMKAHIIRSKNQERARTQCVDQMTDGDVVVTFDWAMKFLPRKYREGQIDWFGKRGINWHFAVVLYKFGASFHNLTYIHIFKSQVPQDAPTTSAVMIDVVGDIISMFPKIQNVHLFSDNAGCYKSNSTIAAIKTDLGTHVKSYNFSEAQNGKGPCDRNASHAKTCIKQYVNEGNDVTTAESMKTAIEKHQSGSFRVSVVDVEDTDVEKTKFNIPGISTFNNFRFEDSGLRMWKAFGIGEGKLQTWNNLPTAVSPHLLKAMPSTPVTCSQFIKDDQEHTAKKTRQFFCQNEGCIKTFTSSRGLEQHSLTGACDLKIEKMTLNDRAKSTYSDKLQQDHSVTITSGFAAVEGRQSCPMGWALKAKKPKTVFSDKQKTFMRKKFYIGKKNGKKIDPYIAAEDMTNGGDFKKNEFLTGQQIASFFSRLSQNEKKIEAGDFAAARNENEKSEIKLKIAKTLNI